MRLSHFIGLCVAGTAVSAWGAILQSPDIEITGLTALFDYGVSSGGGIIIGGGGTGTAPSGSSDQAISGQYVMPGFAANLSEYDGFSVHFAAPSGQRFVVRSISGLTEYISLSAEWQVDNTDVASAAAISGFAFDDLAGTPPVPRISTTTPVIGQGGRRIRAAQQFDITGDFQFSGVTLTMSYDPACVASYYGTFSPLPPKFGAFWSGTTNSPVMTLVPEPHTAGLLCAASALCLFRRRRRSHHRT